MTVHFNEKELSEITSAVIIAEKQLMSKLRPGASDYNVITKRLARLKCIHDKLKAAKTLGNTPKKILMNVEFGIEIQFTGIELYVSEFFSSDYSTGVHYVPSDFPSGTFVYGRLADLRQGKIVLTDGTMNKSSFDKLLEWKNEIQKGCLWHRGLGITLSDNGKPTDAYIALNSLLTSIEYGPHESNSRIYTFKKISLCHEGIIKTFEEA